MQLALFILLCKAFALFLVFQQELVRTLEARVAFKRLASSTTMSRIWMVLEIAQLGNSSITPFRVALVRLSPVYVRVWVLRLL